MHWSGRSTRLAVTTIVPMEHRARAGGLASVIESGAFIFSPLPPARSSRRSLRHRIERLATRTSDDRGQPGVTGVTSMPP